MRRLLSIFFLLLPLLSTAQEKGLDEIINDGFEPIANWWEGLVLTSLPIMGFDVPLVVILLVLGALVFTIYFKVPGISRFLLAINVVRGHYEDVEKGTGAEDGVHITETGDVVGTIRDERSGWGSESLSGIGNSCFWNGRTSVILPVLQWPLP